MDTFQANLVSLISTPLFVFVIGLEIILSHIHPPHKYNWRDSLNNFALSILSGLTDLLVRGLSLIVLAFTFKFRLFSFEHGVIYWVALLFLVDISHYWLHRLGHTVRLIWAMHVNHHSSDQFNFTVGFRASVLEPFYRFLFFIPLTIIGFKPIDIFFIYSITEIWSILTHTEKVGKLGWLEYIFVTPSHHRVHHASNPKYLDRNMGTLFIFWDKLFGTFQKELPELEYEPIRYGLTKPLEKENIPHLIFHEWKNIINDLRRRDLSWKNKWKYLFGPPGWSHDGSSLTSKQLRLNEKKKLLGDAATGGKETDSHVKTGYPWGQAV
jgi:sterol desaturase/sphingolipid hydroxylase (fatty acid hydroxylase superfamily)